MIDTTNKQVKECNMSTAYRQVSPTAINLTIQPTHHCSLFTVHRSLHKSLSSPSDRHQRLISISIGMAPQVDGAFGDEDVVRCGCRVLLPGCRCRLQVKTMPAAIGS